MSLLIAPAAVGTSSDLLSGHAVAVSWVAIVFVLLILSALIPIVRLAGARRRHRELEHEVADRTAELERLGELVERVNEAVRLDDVLNQIYDSLRGAIPFDRIGVAFLDDTAESVRAVWARSESKVVGIPSGYQIALRGSSLQSILESGEPRIIGDLERYLREHPGSDSTRRIVSEGMRASLTFPLRALGSPVGFIFFSSADLNAYNASHIAFFRQLAGQVSLAITKSRLYEDLLVTKARLEAVNRELESLATADGLTGLANRRAFDQALEVEWRRATRTQNPISLLFVDVDCFKLYNDRYGHLAGDDCLRRVAAILALTVRRAGDVAARYGGEEFAVLLPDTAAMNAFRIAEEIRRSIELLGIAHEASTAAPVVTVSIGCSTLLRGENEPATKLVSAADAALYEAKSAGRNRVAVAAAPDASVAELTER